MKKSFQKVPNVGPRDFNIPWGAPRWLQSQEVMKQLPSLFPLKTKGR